jgi:hypothetical protein
VRGGEKLTAKQISKSCEDHKAKQGAVALSTTLRVDPNTQLSAAVQNDGAHRFSLRSRAQGLRRNRNGNKSKTEEGPEVVRQKDQLSDPAWQRQR